MMEDDALNKSYDACQRKRPVSGWTIQQLEVAGVRVAVEHEKQLVTKRKDYLILTAIIP